MDTQLCVKKKFSQCNGTRIFNQGNVGRLLADFLTVNSNNNYLVIYIYIYDFLVLFYLH